MKIVNLGLLLVVFLAASCGDGTQQEEETANVEVSALDHIASLEKLVMTQEEPKLQRITAKNLVMAYLKYVEENPTDKECPAILLKAADWQNSDLLAWNEKAAATYKQVYDNYPAFSDRAFALFMQAAVTDFKIGDKEHAEKLYNQLVSEYPQDDWAEQARQRLTTINLTDAEFIEMAKKKNAL